MYAGGGRRDRLKSQRYLDFPYVFFEMYAKQSKCRKQNKRPKSLYYIKVIRGFFLGGNNDICLISKKRAFYLLYISLIQHNNFKYGE